MPPRRPERADRDIDPRSRRSEERASPGSPTSRGARRRGRLLSLAVAALVSAARPAPLAAQPSRAEPASEDLAAAHERWRAAVERDDLAEGAALADRYFALLEGTSGLDNELAHFYLGYGDYARAEALLVRGLTREQPSFNDEGMLYARLANVYLDFGDLQSAEELLKRAQPLLQGWGEFYAVDSLARLYLERRALRSFAEALDRMRVILREATGGSGWAYAIPDLRAAQLSLRRGQVEEAERRLLDLRPRLEPALPAQSAVRADLLEELGVLFTRKGDPAAEALLLQALVIRERVFAPDHPAIVRALGHLANLYVAQGRTAVAVRTRERAAGLQDRSARANLARGSERQKRLYMGLVQRDTDATLSLHLQDAPRDQAAARLALRSILRRKGLALDAIAESFASLRQSLDAEGRALLGALTQLDAKLSTAITRGPIDVPAEEHQREVQQLEAERQRLEFQLAARTRAARPADAKQPPITVEGVQAAIPDGAALVEIVQYRPYDPFGPPVRPTWGKPRYAAYVVGRRGGVTGVDLGDAAAIDAAAAELSRDLSNPERDPRERARHLDALVMQPIRGALGPARWLLLSPDGALNLVPFSALVDEEGGYLIDRASFTYLTSGRDLLRAAGVVAPQAGAPRGSVLVIADPAFGSLSELAPDDDATRGLRSAELAGARFPPLPGTEREAEAVRSALASATVLTGPSATEEALKRAQRPRVLHIATHGFFLPDQGSPGEPANTRGAEIEGHAFRENPLLRSGLALAGANARRSSSDEDDGILTALEISSLDLHGTQLVVLSACETGLGEVPRGDGVYGLRRALLLAGAETQVMSLWKVGDMATRDLMTSYYAALARGGGRSEALRSAQLQIRRERPHPHAWAGFITSGEGAALDGRRVAPSFPRAAPGPRGCACAAGEEGPSAPPALAALAAALVLVARKRWPRRAGNW
ncbi:CHAT domain-containing tetratricopeptide repeat protein [Sorangium sp. So ce1504]|uniref:CHAT domain-containing protein n=1 Tax=Sorangium sp. So ce1504 TaxID=3133337 RepID=UPI003F5E4271